MAPDDLFDPYDDDTTDEVRLGLAIPDTYKCRSHPTLTADERDLLYRVRMRRLALRNRLKGATE